MTMAIMTSIDNLVTWVSERTNDLEREYIDAIVDVIRDRSDCPPWGRDWSEFLEALPDNLIDLVDLTDDDEESI